MTIQLNEQEGRTIAQQMAKALKRNIERLESDLKEAEQAKAEAQGDTNRTTVLLAKIDRIKAEIDRYTAQENELKTAEL